MARTWAEIGLMATDAAEVVARSAASETGVLSRREREVLAELAAGGTNEVIAGRLFISPKTVTHHTTAIYRKLGVRSRAEAVGRAYREGLLRAE